MHDTLVHSTAFYPEPCLDIGFDSARRFPEVSNIPSSFSTLCSPIYLVPSLATKKCSILLDIITKAGILVCPTVVSRLLQLMSVL